MTIEQAKEIVKTAPTCNDSREQYLAALKVLAGSWVIR
jgi:protein involved in temperature-dependent protein secretion